MKVPRNDGTDYADYLLAGVPVTAIAVDGANRKWVGTQGDGVYLLSPDGVKTIHHSKRTILLSFPTTFGALPATLLTAV